MRYKAIVGERFFISTNCATSYADTANITPLEKDYLIEFINEKLESEKKALEEARNKHKSK